MDTSEWTGGASYEYVPYSDVSGSDYLHLYVPDAEEPMPLIIMVHGGGFVCNDCESRQAQFMYRYFRQHGYACATVNYRLAQEDGFPAALEDVKAAVRYLRANAETYGYDPDRFIIWGESAGGYLATMAAVTNDDEFTGVSFIGEDELAEPVSAQVSCLIDFYGIIDFPFADSDFRSQGSPI
ncbi:MAG: alpha/beta hydrolase [Clostridiales bacterium]|nr:alpha/beta hydrolase [Clostridiales bacterium]